MVIRITSIAVIAVRELTISPFTSFDRNEWEIVILWNDDSSEKKKKKKKNSTQYWKFIKRHVVFR